MDPVLLFLILILTMKTLFSKPNSAVADPHPKSGKPENLVFISNQSRENQGSCVYLLYPIKVRKTRDLVFVHSKVRKVFPFYIAV